MEKDREAPVWEDFLEEREIDGLDALEAAAAMHLFLRTPKFVVRYGEEGQRVCAFAQSWKDAPPPDAWLGRGCGFSESAEALAQAEEFFAGSGELELRRGGAGWLAWDGKWRAQGAGLVEAAVKCELKRRLGSDYAMFPCAGLDPAMERWSFWQVYPWAGPCEGVYGDED